MKRRPCCRATAPIAAALYGDFGVAVLLTGLAALCIWNHRANIGRLIDGDEPRVGRAK